MAAAQTSPALLEQSDTPTRASAPYGQACTNCAKAKCKCILVVQTNSGSGRGASRPTCERCARLGRECKPSNTVRKRGGAGSRRAAGRSASSDVPNGISAASRAANLEQKLEDLVAILKAQTGSTPAQASSQPDAGQPHRQGIPDQNARAELGVVPASGPGRRSNNMGNGIAASGPTVITPASTSYATCSTADSTPSPLSAPADDTLTSTAEAEATLAFFRQHHLKTFPFVYIPPDTTAAQLQRDRPYLWLNISAICCRSPIKQASLSLRTRSELAHRILITCERNIDILLGAICLLGWTTHLCFKPTMSAVIGMAIAVVTDLRLDKPTHDDDPRVMNCFKSAHFVRTPHSIVRTMEERRATLACYVICLSGSSFLKCSTMRWTPQMEDSLKILTANPECEGDQILVLMVRIQRLADIISQSQATWASETGGYSTLKPPVNIYIKYFKQCLQTIKDQLPESLKDHRLATSLILSAEMTISEIPFSNIACWNSHIPELHTTDTNPQPCGGGAPSHSARPMDIGRLEASFATLQASKAQLEHFLTFELADHVGLSFPVLLNFFRSAQSLYRLHLIVDPGWDHSAVAGSIDLPAAMELVAHRYDQIPALYGFLDETDADGNEVTNFYSKCAKTFTATLPMWRANFAQAEAARMGSDASAGTRADVGVDAARTGHQAPLPMMGVVNPTLGGRVNYPGMNNFMLPELFPMDFSLDEVWSNDILSSWDAGMIGPMQ
ncbi:hypothetical protein F4825DRAFT_193988 [Nemania diffusa]|nr:hypothetical protein F4825DRAFT_193988 [Nemania diffusa]